MSCKASDEVKIEGNVKGIPNGIIYLTDAYDWKAKIIDSTSSKNGIFSFHISPKKGFESHEVSIVFNNKKGQKEKLVFNGIPHLGLDGREYGGGSAFMLEKGLTTIKGDLHGFSLYSLKTMFLGDIELKGGKQSLAYFNTNEFISIQHDTTAKTQFRNKKLIMKYPYSYFLINEIYKNKEQYTNQQLKTMMLLFDQDIQNSRPASKVYSFIDRRGTDNAAIYLTKKHFFSVDKKEEVIVKGRPSINLLVFWASWCGPCRAEIPYIKSLYKKFGQKINITSISIDEKHEKWVQALAQEQMPWRQLWIGDNAEYGELVAAAFKFSAIPAVILMSESNSELKRSYGFSVSEIQAYDKIIEEKLKSP